MSRSKVSFERGPERTKRIDPQTRRNSLLKIVGQQGRGAIDARRCCGGEIEIDRGKNEKQPARNERTAADDDRTLHQHELHASRGSLFAQLVLFLIFSLLFRLFRQRPCGT